MPRTIHDLAPLIIRKCEVYVAVVSDTNNHHKC